MYNRMFWGAGFDEYRDVFALDDKALSGKIIEFGCGPTVLNQQAHQHGQNVVSYDALFSLSADALAASLKKEEGQLLASQKQSLAVFLDDYPRGQREGRYLSIDAELPTTDYSYDLALSAHHFLVDDEQQALDAQIIAIKALARVAKEVRIFPLNAASGEVSPLLGPLLLGLQQENYGTEVKEVSAPNSQPANAMLRVWAQQCVME